MVSARKPPTYGPEPWNEAAGAVWSHWDLWFSLVCVTDFASDWRGLEEAIVGSRRRSYGGRDWEAKDSHLHDLEARLLASGMDAATLVAGHRGDKAVLAKARRKVLEQSLGGRDLTRPCGTPRGSDCGPAPCGIPQLYKG